RRSLLTDPKGSTVAYSYDPNGNPLTITAVAKSDLGNPSRTFIKTYTYDNLNRNIQAIDNLGQTNRVNFDSRNKLASLLDPRNNLVRYSYDGLGRLIEK